MTRGAALTVVLVLGGRWDRIPARFFAQPGIQLGTDTQSSLWMVASLLPRSLVPSYLQLVERYESSRQTVPPVVAPGVGVLSAPPVRAVKQRGVAVRRV